MALLVFELAAAAQVAVAPPYIDQSGVHSVLLDACFVAAQAAGIPAENVVCHADE